MLNKFHAVRTCSRSLNESFVFPPVFLDVVDVRCEHDSTWTRQQYSFQLGSKRVRKRGSECHYLIYFYYCFCAPPLKALAPSIQPAIRSSGNFLGFFVIFLFFLVVDRGAVYSGAIIS